MLIADVDVDTPGCDRRMHIYRNLGGMPGGEVVLQEQTTGERCPSPGCLIAGIPRDQLTGVHDVAVFDIDQDGWNDLVVGRCSGTQIYMGQEPTGLVFTYPQGLPFFVPPGETYVFQVQLTVFGPVTPVPGTVKLFVSIGGGATEEVPLVDLGDDRFEAQLPAAACGAGIEFYVEGEASNGEIFRDPPSAPSDRYRAVGALGKVISWEDDLESGTDGWTVVNDPSLTAGGWEAAAPNGTLTGFGEQAAPDGDAQAAEGQVIAFVTDNGPPGGAVGDHDVDGGPTDLISPPINLAGSDGTISYSRWFFTASVSNTLTVWVTANGTDWELVETVTGGSHNQWEVASFRVSDYVTPSSAVQVRFRTADNPNSSITEAGVDLMRLERLICNDCTEAADCDDGLFCTGAEDCVAGTCVTGSDPCPGQACDEALDVCVGCNVDQDCDDGIYCNGLEACVDRQCEPGGDPCPGETCDEALDTCLECVVDADCDDGAFCNGAEQCLAGSCRPGGEACPGRSCDEEVDACLGTVALQPRMGQPLLGLTPDELDRFERGRTAFDSPLTAERGLGPIFNQNSCGSCHNTPLGGSGSTTVTRFGFVDDKAGGFNPLESLGGSLRQSQAIAPECAEIVPAQANITAERVTSSVLGAGLIEAIPDDQILSLQSAGPGVSGRAHQVAALEAPETMRVGRFGWKAQVASLLTFSADAAVNEMGLTNRLLPDENAPNGDAELLGVCDTVPDPEDVTDSDGFDFIDRVTDFQRFLAAPPQTPRSGMSGEQVFVDVGCAGCHVSTFVTAADEAVPAALRGKTVRPYSDFLLHDMGQSADFIEHGQALQREIRTPALWGVRVRDPLWHDGRFVGGLFADRVMAAIDAHDALGSEAAAAAQSLAARPEDHPALIAFLDSLGRAEFDHDGDGDVDFQDYDELVVCFSGPGVFYGPDDPCSVSDPDQDGDVDEDDLELFRQTVLAPAGGVPNGADRAGNALVLERSPSEQLELTWGGSCSAQDDDFAVYTGPLGDFADPQPLSCGTGGFTRAIVAAPPESSYFLVVPLNAFREGSYGTDSEGRERAPSTAACLPQTTGACF